MPLLIRLLSSVNKWNGSEMLLFLPVLPIPSPSSKAGAHSGPLSKLPYPTPGIQTWVKITQGC